MTRRPRAAANAAATVATSFPVAVVATPFAPRCRRPARLVVTEDRRRLTNAVTHLLLVLLLLVTVVLAIVGFFVGLFLAAILIQRIVRRHLLHLHKKQLVREFRVQDLSHYKTNDDIIMLDDDNEATGLASSSIYQAPPLLPPHYSPPKLHPKDEAHLRKLGLLTEYNIKDIFGAVDVSHKKKMCVALAKPRGFVRRP